MTLAAVWAFLKKIPYQVWLVLGGIALGWAFVEAQKAEAVRRNNEKNERERLEEQGRMDEARRQQSTENQANAQRADETADSVPWVRARDELWERSPRDAAILLDPVEPSGS